MFELLLDVVPRTLAHEARRQGSSFLRGMSNRASPDEARQKLPVLRKSGHKKESAVAKALAGAVHFLLSVHISGLARTLALKASALAHEA